MNNTELHSILRSATIRLCDLPEAEVTELDREIAEAFRLGFEENS